MDGPLVLSILTRFDQLEIYLDASGIENDDVQFGRAAGRTDLAGLAKCLGTVGSFIKKYKSIYMTFWLGHSLRSIRSSITNKDDILAKEQR